MIVSIFNDVIGPVMRGPSSSHCVAALRIGRIARDLMGGDIAEVLVEFDRSGSLPTTHASQGSDMGLCGGLLGWDADDERLPNSMAALTEEGIGLRFETVDAGDPHPNTYRLSLKNSREKHTLIGVSTGGGMVEVLSVDGLTIAMDGGWHETLIWLAQGTEYHFDKDEVIAHDAGDFQVVQIKGDTFVPQKDLVPLQPLRVRRISPVLPVPSRPDVRVPFSTPSEMFDFDGAKNTPLWEMAITYECVRGGLGREDVVEMMTGIVRIVRRSINQGVAGTSYDDRILGFQSGSFEQRMNDGMLLDAGALNRIILYVTAMMEVKSSMGVIVAMPTAGACATLPGTIVGMAEELHLGEDAMAHALLAGGMIGVFVATAWTFAAEAGGCQAECGVASAMSAAALVTLAGGSRDQAVAAASMALQNLLGLVCDPVANRVEVPCLGKNVTAAANALASANMALAGYDQVIPLEEVIAAAKQVGSQLPRELRCTALGGLSVTTTSKRIEQKLRKFQGRD